VPSSESLQPFNVPTKEALGAATSPAGVVPGDTSGAEPVPAPLVAIPISRHRCLTITATAPGRPGAPDDDPIRPVTPRSENRRRPPDNRGPPRVLRGPAPGRFRSPRPRGSACQPAVNAGLPTRTGVSRSRATSPEILPAVTRVLWNERGGLI
jgi:hypothetical protein